MRLGKIRKDDDGHWFLIPDDLVDDFDAGLDVIQGIDYLDNPVAFDVFNTLYSQYKIDGIYDLSVVMGDAETLCVIRY